MESGEERLLTRSEGHTSESRRKLKLSEAKGVPTAFTIFPIQTANTATEASFASTTGGNEETPKVQDTSVGPDGASFTKHYLSWRQWSSA